MSETTTKAQRVLPADVYDALELSALAYGGIGAGSWSQWGGDMAGAPYCAFGHAGHLDAFGCHTVAEALADARIGVCTNDNAVIRINTRAGMPGMNRVSFEDWCAELGVVRGDS